MESISKQHVLGIHRELNIEPEFDGEGENIAVVGNTFTLYEGIVRGQWRNCIIKSSKPGNSYFMTYRVEVYRSFAYGFDGHCIYNAGGKLYHVLYHSNDGKVFECVAQQTAF